MPEKCYYYTVRHLGHGHQCSLASAKCGFKAASFMNLVCLALQGFALEKLIAARAKCTDESERVVAKVQVWSDHAELLQMVKLAMRK